MHNSVGSHHKREAFGVVGYRDKAPGKTSRTSRYQWQGRDMIKVELAGSYNKLVAAGEPIS
jgi:hypothetical protein